MPYIVCEKRRGSPRLNVEVCRRKCQFMEDCESYGRYLSSSDQEDSSLDIETHANAAPHHAGAGEEVQAA